ncbi:MAG: SDR family oxidoreductase [Thermoleophilia bacterium]|nr:SDR family oxidoreductase [Thermoleophilia bacterium]
MGTMTGKTALVTGAGSGIGRAVALAFAGEGAQVMAGDIDEAAAGETVRLAREGGGVVFYRRCDVSSGEEVADMVDHTIATFGCLDFACNVAGIHNPFPEMLAEADEDTWDRIIATNLKGVFLCTKHEVRAMAAQGHGVIVNMSSVSGLLAESGCYAYVASKHGILGLTKTAALDCARLGIRINAVCPGAIETPGLMKSSEEFRRTLREKTPVGRLGKPEEVAAAVLWLCSDQAGYVTGTGLVMDGGVSIV